MSFFLNESNSSLDKLLPVAIFQKLIIISLDVEQPKKMLHVWPSKEEIFKCQE